MKNFNVINFHITNKCNYSCKYCFGKFEGNEIPLSDAKQVIDSISQYFSHNKIKNGRINLAGGEPLLHPQLDAIIDYCYQKDIKVSIVTNGSLLTKEKIECWAGKACQIGISIDSASTSTCLEIGRVCKKSVLCKDTLLSIVQAIKKNGIELKINTVVSSFNINEDLTSLYLALSPKKLKLFQMHLVKDVNDSCSGYSISTDEFLEYCKKYEALPFNVVIEKQGDMESSYIMIDPNGKLIMNIDGCYEVLADLTREQLCNVPIPLDAHKFALRYKSEV